MAKLKESESKEMNIGFRIPAGGTYNWVINEGIKINRPTEESKTQSVRLDIPCEILSVARGVKNNTAEESEAGSSARYSLFLIGKDGTPNEKAEENLCQFLTIVGVMKRLMEKFPGELDFTDQKFIDTLALALPGKQFEGKHRIRKWKNDSGEEQDQINWEKISEVKKAGDAAVKESSSESDW